MTDEISVDRMEDSDNDWDLESAVLCSGVKSPSVVVAVRLKIDDFDKIAKCAHADGVPLSTFFLNAAIEKVDRPG